MSTAPQIHAPSGRKKKRINTNHSLHTTKLCISNSCTRKNVLQLMGKEHRVSSNKLQPRYSLWEVFGVSRHMQLGTILLCLCILLLPTQMGSPETKCKQIFWFWDYEVVTKKRNHNIQELMLYLSNNNKVSHRQA